MIEVEKLEHIHPDVMDERVDDQAEYARLLSLYNHEQHTFRTLDHNAHVDDVLQEVNEALTEYGLRVSVADAEGGTFHLFKIVKGAEHDN